MKADLIKRCVRALAEAGDGNFDGLCEQLIQDERRKVPSRQNLLPTSI